MILMEITLNSSPDGWKCRIFNLFINALIRRGVWTDLLFLFANSRATYICDKTREKDFQATKIVKILIAFN